MHYIEIGQDIVDAIKGGAEGSSQSESDEVVGYINSFSEYFYTIVVMVKEFVMEIYNAFNK